MTHLRLGRALWFAVAVLVVMAAACTDPDAEVDAGGPSEPDSDGGWQRHTLGTVADDREILGTQFGDGLAVLTVEEPGDLRAFLLDADGTVSEASVDAGTSDFRLVTAITDGPNGLVAIGNDVDQGLRNFVLTSPDGTAWSKVATSGIEIPMDVSDLVATDDRYIAIGALRTAEDPAQGGFVPVVMTSADGTTWSSAQIPSNGDGSLRSVVSLESGLYAAGEVGGAPVVWSSTDDGRTWTPVEGAPATSQILAAADTMLAIEQRGEGFTLQRSEDGGETWHTADNGLADEFGHAWFFSDGNGFTMSGELKATDYSSSSLESCYADVEACRARSSVDPPFLFSTDGITWDRLDLTSLDGLFRPSSIVHNEAGDTVVLGTTDDGQWGAWFWDSEQGAVPTTEPDQPEMAEYDGPPIVEYGATLEEGVRYALPLGLHCGMDRLGEFNGRQWELVESPTGDAPETGAGDPVPEDWPSSPLGLLGYVTMIDDGRIEYSIQDGEVIAVYAPLPEDAEPVYCA